MRISDWSSDVCSSDLLSDNPSLQAAQARIAQARASVRQEKAGRFPTLGTQATAIQGRLPGLDIQNSAPPSASATDSPQGQADDSLSVYNLGLNANRSEERRVGEECVRKCRCRWSQ